MLHQARAGRALRRASEYAIHVDGKDRDTYPGEDRESQAGGGIFQALWEAGVERVGVRDGGIFLVIVKCI
jgi:hypothetical protein